MTNEDMVAQYLKDMGLEDDEIESLFEKHGTQYSFGQDLVPQHQGVLIYDIETTTIKADIFRLGEQRVTHKDLCKAHNITEIICITYIFNDGKPAKALHWGYGPETCAEMVDKFDKIIKEAQDNNYLIIGKNNKRFDDKHINTQRWLNGHDPLPDWTKYTDDLEKQIRKHFNLPSFALDYISELRGLGGKMPMEKSDWVNIVNYKLLMRLEHALGYQINDAASEVLFKSDRATVVNMGILCFEKMIEYGCTDAQQTLDLVLDVMPYCEFKDNSVKYKGQMVCKVPTCKSSNLSKNGNRVLNGVVYKQFKCEHGHYSGKARIKEDGTYGVLK